MQAPISQKCAAPYNSSVAVNMDCYSPTGMLNATWHPKRDRQRESEKQCESKEKKGLTALKPRHLSAMV